MLKHLFATVEWGSTSGREESWNERVSDCPERSRVSGKRTSLRKQLEALALQRECGAAVVSR